MDQRLTAPAVFVQHKPGTTLGQAGANSFKYATFQNKEAPPPEAGVLVTLETVNGVQHAIDGCSVPPDIQRRLLAPGLMINKAIPGPNLYINPLAESFYQACRSHDICYQTCGSKQGACDKALNDSLASSCDAIAPDVPGTGFFSLYVNPADSLIAQPADPLNGNGRLYFLGLRHECNIFRIQTYQGLSIPVFGGVAAHNTRQNQMCLICPK